MRLKRLWGDLASGDSGVGFEAVILLGTVPEEAVKLFGERLKPVPIPKAETIKALIDDLGSDDFTTRETATQELAKLERAVEQELRANRQDKLPERRDRVERLLKAIEKFDNPQRLRA